MLTLGLCTQRLPGIERSNAEVKQRCQTLCATRQVQQPKPCKAWGMEMHRTAFRSDLNFLVDGKVVRDRKVELQAQYVGCGLGRQPGSGWAARSTNTYMKPAWSPWPGAGTTRGTSRSSSDGPGLEYLRLACALQRPSRIFAHCLILSRSTPAGPQPKRLVNEQLLGGWERTCAQWLQSQSTWNVCGHIFCWHSQQNMGGGDAFASVFKAPDIIAISWAFMLAHATCNFWTKSAVMDNCCWRAKLASFLFDVNHARSSRIRQKTRSSCASLGTNPGAEAVSQRFQQPHCTAWRPNLDMLRDKAGRTQLGLWDQSPACLERHLVSPLSTRWHK